jgi:hypothetical protein
MLHEFGFARFLAEAKSSRDQIKELRVLPKATASQLTEAVKESSHGYGEKTRPAKDSPREKTKAGDVFKRFCAFPNDRRVLPDGSLRQGTYGTTDEDAGNVKTGKQAVARYALPNPRPASYRFTIKPHENTMVQCGIVEPAYGQPGGGVEVLFTQGTHPKTVTGRDKIPDE